MFRFYSTVSISALLFLSYGVSFTSPAQAEELKARIETNWRYGSERSILMTEFWVPFTQDENSVLYGDIRMMGDDQDNREGNLGIGYRKILKDTALGDGVAGLHGWIDRRITERNSTFHQVTLGVEWLGEEFDVLANTYIPLSSEVQHSIPNADPQGPALVGTGIVVDTNGMILEEPQAGFDLEFGWELGQSFDFVKENTDALHLYAGGYYFDGDDTQSVSGWRTRFTADVTRNIQVGARFQKDDERGSQGFLEATFRFPFGHKKSYRHEGLRARLDDSPERDIDIVTGDVVTDPGDRIAVLNQETGQAQEVLHVDNTAAGSGDGSAEAPFNTLAAAQSVASAHTVIYVHRGDGTSANQNQGITLDKDGQQLIGSGANFVYDNGRFKTANGGTPTSTVLVPAGSAPVLTNVNASSDGVRVTADDIMVAGITVDGATRDGIVVEADGAAASAQNVTITDVSAINNRLGIYIHGTNDGSVSAKVQRSVTSSNSQHGIAVYDDTNGKFESDLGGGSMGSVGKNVLAGNTLEDLAVDLDGGTLAAMNNWWGQASGPDIDDPSVGIAPQIYYGAPISDGLVGHWTFDTEWTTNTTAYDRSGQGSDGTLLGGLSLADQVAGQNREALDLDGVDDEILIGNIGSLTFNNSDSFTLFSYASPSDGATSQGYLFSKNSTTRGYGFFYDFANDRVSLTRHNIQSSYVSNVDFIDTNWVNAVGVFVNQNTSYYRNSVAAGTAASNNFITPSTIDARIGDRTGGNNAATQYDGGIDEVRIYNRALGVSEISELYRMDTSGSVNTGGFLTSSP